MFKEYVEYVESLVYRCAWRHFKREACRLVYVYMSTVINVCKVLG